MKYAKFFITTGRVICFFAILALLGAWTAHATDKEIMGMNEQHLFNDATVLSILSLVFLFGGFLHSKDL